MIALIDAPRRGCLQRETPLGVPAITPLNVQSVSGKLYEFDGLILRLEYLGGLSGEDPSASGWTLYTTTLPQLSGHRRVASLSTSLSHEMRSSTSAHTTEADSELTSYQEALAAIERVTGFSRRELTEWLQTSHTTLNGIANASRTPRLTLAKRIANFSRLVTRLEMIFGNDKGTIQHALTTQPENGRSALSYVLDDDYQQAATAAQHAIRPPRQLKQLSGQTFFDEPMVAVEDI